MTNYEQAKHIGILAHSAEGSSLCYLAAVHEGIRRMGEHMHPDISLDIIPMALAMPLYAKKELRLVRDILVKSIDRLAAAGCDFFICPDNTAHMALEMPGDDFPLPGLHIAGVVAGEAARKGFRKIGVLGTKWTMEGPLYKEAFQRVGLDSEAPGEKDRIFIDDVIFDELCNGIFSEESQKEYVRIISGLADKGCDAVVLGCTEIPLLISPEISPLPTLDSTRALAVAAIDVALTEQPMPTWRGGPAG